MFKKRHNTITKLCTYAGNRNIEAFERIAVCQVDNENIYFGLTFGRWYQVEPVDAMLKMENLAVEKYLLMESFLNDSTQLTQSIQRINNHWMIKS